MSPNNNNGYDDDWDSVDSSQETLIRNGDYRIALERVKQETVKSGGNVGKPRYNCQFTVTDNQQTGRKVFMDFMPYSDISRSQVKALAMATNTALGFSDMYQVLMGCLDKEFLGRVGVRKDKTGKYSDQNTIRVFSAVQAMQSPTGYAPVLPPVFPAVETFTGADGVSKWVKDAAMPGGFRQVG